MATPYSALQGSRQKDRLGQRVRCAVKTESVAAATRRHLVLAAFAIVFFCTQSSRAEVYSWTDDEGVVHFTNVPPHAVTPLKAPNAQNTFDWTDNLGKMRKVHRVDVVLYDDFVADAATYYDLPPALIKAVIATESAFEPKAVSLAGARGLMQLMPQTARAMHVKDSFDPDANIFGGTSYIRLMANRFDGDLRKTIASYNAGPEAVEQYGDVPPFEETQTYVKRVLKLFRYYQQQAAGQEPTE